MRYLFLILTLICAYSLKAQVEAPEFICVNNDTLIWQAPTNITCGPHLGYIVFAANSINGEYTAIDTVFDPAQLTYANANPSGLPFYYYLESLVDCPGQMLLTSDTLDNLPPPQSPIEFVSVNGGNIEIEWSTVSASDVIGYIVYRVTDIGTIPIDTVYGGNNYIDLNANPDIQPEFYYVNSLDACGTNSFFDQPHNTIFLENEIDSCNQSANLTWNPYNNWTQGVLSYTVRVSENGGAFNDLAIVPPGITFYELENLDKNITYQVEIVATRADMSVTSSSNLITFTPDIRQTILGLNVFNADVQGSDILVEWTWDVSSEIQMASIEVYNGTNLVQSVDIDVQGGPLQNINQELITNLNPDQNVYSFLIRATDVCGKTILSEPINSLRITGTLGSSGSSEVQWNSAVQGDRSMNEILLFRGETGMGEQIAILPASAVSATDNAGDVLLPCYYIIAQGTVVLANGSTYMFNQTSNLVCIAKPVKIYLPNALSPKGVNNVYLPAIINRSSITQYELKIFDRWGSIIFETQVPEIGWDGTWNGQLVVMGVYAYYINIEQINGNTIKRSGTITVLY